MATDFIDRLREARFPTARRGGYDPRAVDTYLAELAEWLETGGEDQSRAELVQREISRVGERTGSILAAAQQSADQLKAEAEAEVAQLRSEAEAEARNARADADSYASETRDAADSYASETRKSADGEVRISAEASTREAVELRAAAEAEANEKRKAADDRLQRASDEAAARTAGVEREIAELLRARDAVKANLEELATGIRDIVDGPGSEELDVPEAAKPPEPAAQLSDPDTAREHPLVDASSTARAWEETEETVESASSTTRAWEETEETVESEDADPDATALMEIEADDDPTNEAEPTASGIDDFDTDEQEERRLRARERELKRRRRPSSDDPPTEDQTLTDLL